MSSRRLTSEEEYFDELYDTVFVGNITKNFYDVCWQLHATEFEFSVYLDKNRYADGESYRERLGYEDVKSGCSVFEMMVALAVRIEEDIMDDPQYGCRISQWFWHMFSNLGLAKYDDKNYDGDAVYDIIQRFLNREYNEKKGGIFKFRHRTPSPIEDVELWTQMSWYINEVT